MSINYVFAENSGKMVVKSSKETTSMHIITIFTLIFLPGTFVSVSCDALHPLWRFETNGNVIRRWPRAEYLFGMLI